MSLILQLLYNYWSCFRNHNNGPPLLLKCEKGILRKASTEAEKKTLQRAPV